MTNEVFVVDHFDLHSHLRRKKRNRFTHLLAQKITQLHEIRRVLAVLKHLCDCILHEQFAVFVSFAARTQSSFHCIRRIVRVPLIDLEVVLVYHDTRERTHSAITALECVLTPTIVTAMNFAAQSTPQL